MSGTTLTITPSGGGTAYTLASSPGRSGDGTPVGPDGLDFRTDKGVLDREPIGADGIDSEAVGCDRRALTFSVRRVYASDALALAGAVHIRPSVVLRAGAPAPARLIGLRSPT